MPYKKHILIFWLRPLVLLGILCLVSSDDVWGQFPQMPTPTTVLNKESGLPDEYITCIMKDHHGYVWIGTRQGLCRYDGSTFKLWKRDELQDSTLSSNWIISLASDVKTNLLWIGTSKGLNFLDLNTDKLSSPPPQDSINKLQIDKEWITGIYNDGDGGFWIYNYGLYYYDYSTHTSTMYWNDTNEKTNMITQLIPDKNDENIFWLATMGGFVKFNKKTRKFIGNYKYHASTKEDTDKLNQIELFLYQTTDGKVYSGGLNGGMLMLNPKSEEVSLFDPKGNFNNSTDFHYKSILEISDELLCIVSSKGMIWYNPISQKVDSLISSSLYQVKTITPSLHDNAGRIWISSENGLDIYDPYFNHLDFQRYDKSIMSDYLLPVRLVESEDNNELLFIENADNKVYRFGTRQGKYLSPLSTIDTDDEQPQNLMVSDILINKEKEVILLTKTAIYILKNNKWKRLKQLPFLESPPYTSLFNGLEDDVFVLSLYEGMYQYDLSKDNIEHFDKSYFIGPGWWLYDGFYDSKDRLWINHLNTGFSILDLQNKVYRQIPHNSNNPVQVHRVRDQLWINDTTLMVCGGTQGLGLISRDHPEKGIVKKYSVGENGLITDHIYAIKRDKKGDIWLLASTGILRLDKNNSTFKFFSYTSEDMNINTDMLDQYVLETLENGSMVFSSKHGLIFFNPETIEQNKELPTPVLNTIKVNDQEIDFVRNNNAELKYTDNYLAFNYSAISYTMPQKCTFKYRLVGADKKWNTDKNSRQIKYANLQPGSYEFQLKAANNDYLWSDEIASYSFSILPPWWRTWWAYLIYSASLIGIGFIWYQNQKRKWKLKAALVLEKEKYQNLQSQKKLDVLNAIISGEEKERIRLSRELHDSVGAMIASIKMYFHSLSEKNPKLENDSIFIKTKELISSTYSEVRSISHNLMPMDLLEEGVEKAITDLYENYNVTTETEYQCQFFISNINISDDTLINIYRVTQEITKNIAIHAHASQVLLQLNIDEDYIHLEVENNGVVFNVERAFDKKGIGLQNIKTRVTYLGGELSLISNEKMGTVYSIVIPLSKTIF